MLTAEAGAKTPLRKLTGLLIEETISLGIGILGMPGSTAYGGLIDVLRPKPRSDKQEVRSHYFHCYIMCTKTPVGQVLWVSGAAGAVGGMVGMLAKQLYGCRVIGSCGGPEKGRLVMEKFGFDAVVDYKQVRLLSLPRWIQLE